MNQIYLLDIEILNTIKYPNDSEATRELKLTTMNTGNSNSTYENENKQKGQSSQIVAMKMQA